MSNPKDIIEASQHINKLRQLLAWDLAATVVPSAVVQMQLQTPRANMPVQLWLTGADLEDAITKLIEEELEALRLLGVDTAPMLEEYKAVAQQLATQGSTREQNPS